VTGLFPDRTHCWLGGIAHGHRVVLSVSRLTDSASADRLVWGGVAVSINIIAGAKVLIFLGDPKVPLTVWF